MSDKDKLIERVIKSIDQHDSRGLGLTPSALLLKDCLALLSQQAEGEQVVKVSDLEEHLSLNTRMMTNKFLLGELIKEKAFTIGKPESDDLEKDYNFLKEIQGKLGTDDVTKTEYAIGMIRDWCEEMELKLGKPQGES